MVEFFTFDPSFTSWTPSTQEFHSFTENNKYYKAKASISTSEATADSSSASTITLAPAPVHSYALTMTKRLVCTTDRHHGNSVSFTMEETHTAEVQRDESKCPICAVEMKERQFLLSYQKLKESSKVIRNMCLRKEHPLTRHMCTKHRPYEPSDGIPKCAANNDSHYWRDTRLPYQRRMALVGTPLLDYAPPVPFNSEQKPIVPKRMFKPETPPAEQPVSSYQFGLTIGSYSMRELNQPKPAESTDQTMDWFNYYQQQQQPDMYTVRMAYTKSFDKPDETKVENFPSKRMAAKFDIDNVKPEDM